MSQPELRIDRFVPSPESLSTEDLKKYRVLIFVSFLTSALALSYLVFAALIGFTIGWVMMVIATALFFSLPFFVRAGARGRVVAHVFVAGVFWNTIVLTSVTGGLTGSITSTYIPLIPMVAVMLIDKRAGIMWFGVAIVEVLVLGLAEIGGVPFENRYEERFDAAFELAALAGVVVIVFFVVRYFDATAQSALRQVEEEQERTQALLLNILPEEVAEELKETGEAQAHEFASVTILFSDFKNFTEISAGMSPNDLVEELNVCFFAFDALIEKYNLEKIKTIGDAYMAASGLPHKTASRPADVVSAGLEMQEFMREHKERNHALGKPSFEMRVGIHTGPVVAGIVGATKFQYDIWGDTVNTASRMESNGEAGKVNISRATYQLVKHEPGFHFVARGDIAAKGKGELAMYFVDLQKSAAQATTPAPLGASLRNRAHRSS